MINQTVSHYRILAKIGAGGMGEVYLAEDTSLDRKVALKFLPPLMQDDEIAHRRFLREAKSAAALDHPFICNIHEVAETEDGQDFIVMEYVEGLTLQDKLADGPLQLKDALRVATEVAEALEKAHNAGIVHRDLKLSNIMLTTDGHPKVMDFGLAKKVVREDGTEQDISSALTREGTTLGTLAYMSPEQVKAQQVDHRSDIFSFGIVLYELLTGVHPFRRPLRAETISALLNQEPAPLSRYMDEVSELLEHTVRKMLAKDTNERYQSAHEVRTDLAELSVEITRSTAPVIPFRKKPNWVPVVLGLAGLVSAVFIVYWSWYALRQPGSVVEQDRRSIAVLSLANLSADPENEYFADGITEDITTELSKISDLKVIGRTSAMRFKGSDKSLHEIAQELGVATLLEGSVRKANQRVRIVVQLIDAKTEGHLWAETYDRELDEIFEIQSDVAEKIASALEAELSLAEKVQIEKVPTQNVQAYDLFLMGRHFREIENAESLKTAVDYYEQAILEDPSYAQAYAWMADAYFLMNYYVPGEWMEKAEAAARKALELDETIAAAHVTMSNLQGYDHGDQTSAEMGYKKALELDPGHVQAHREYGLFLLRLAGRLEDGYVELKRALELDPLSHLTNLNMVELHLARNELVQAMELSRKTLELYPNSHLSYLRIGQVYHWLAEYEKAEHWLKRALEIDPNYSETRITLAETYLCQGQFSQASEITQTGLSVSRAAGTHAAGTVALWAGDYSRARAYFEKDEPIWYIRTKATSWGAYPPLILGYIGWKTGDRTGAEKQLSHSLLYYEQLLAAEYEWYEVPEGIAKVHAIRGNKEEAYLWLQKAVDFGWRWYDVASKDPVWDNLHNEPVFQKMMADAKAKVDAMRGRVEAMEKEWE